MSRCGNLQTSGSGKKTGDRFTCLIVSAPISFRHSNMASNIALAFAILNPLARKKRSKELSSSRLRISPSSVRMTRNLWSVSCCHCSKVPSGCRLNASSSPLEETPDPWLWDAQWHRSWIILTPDRSSAMANKKQQLVQQVRRMRKKNRSFYKVIYRSLISQVQKTLWITKFSQNAASHHYPLSSTLSQQYASLIHTVSLKTARDECRVFEIFQVCRTPQNAKDLPLTHDFTFQFSIARFLQERRLL